MDRLDNLKKVMVISSILIIVSFTIIFAVESNPDCVEPTDNQFLELRAVTVKDVAGQNKQVMMELWGNNIEFKRI